MTVQRKPCSIDEYLKNVPEDRRRALEDLRAKIRSIVPSAEECISYRIPAFRLNGVMFAGFCATSKGCSYFPFSGSTLKTLARDLTRYEQTKSSLHFSTDKPLPAVLVRKLIKARIRRRRSDQVRAERKQQKAADGQSRSSRRRDRLTWKRPSSPAPEPSKKQQDDVDF